MHNEDSRPTIKWELPTQTQLTNRGLEITLGEFLLKHKQLPGISTGWFPNQFIGDKKGSQQHTSCYQKIQAVDLWLPPEETWALLPQKLLTAVAEYQHLVGVGNWTCVFEGCKLYEVAAWWQLIVLLHLMLFSCPIALTFAHR